MIRMLETPTPMKPCFLFLSALMILSCGTPPPPATLSDDEALALGDSIATRAQAILMGEVLQAIEREGVPGAVDFCSERAIPLTDSAAALYHVRVQRISNRNRNPSNLLANAVDSMAWEQIAALVERGNKAARLVEHNPQGRTVMYKAIPLGMPTCLKCHGTPGVEIDQETLAMIGQRYPNDPATGYEQGELRGLWKVTFPK